MSSRGKVLVKAYGDRCTYCNRYEGDSRGCGMHKNMSVDSSCPMWNKM